MTAITQGASRASNVLELIDRAETGIQLGYRQLKAGRIYDSEGFAKNSRAFLEIIAGMKVQLGPKERSQLEILQLDQCCLEARVASALQKAAVLAPSFKAPMWGSIGTAELTTVSGRKVEARISYETRDNAPGVEEPWTVYKINGKTGVVLGEASTILFPEFLKINTLSNYTHDKGDDRILGIGKIFADICSAESFIYRTTMRQQLQAVGGHLFWWDLGFRPMRGGVVDHYAPREAFDGAQKEFARVQAQLTKSPSTPIDTLLSTQAKAMRAIKAKTLNMPEASVPLKELFFIPSIADQLAEDYQISKQQRKRLDKRYPEVRMELSDEGRDRALAKISPALFACLNDKRNAELRAGIKR